MAPCRNCSLGYTLNIKGIEYVICRYEGHISIASCRKCSFDLPINWSFGPLVLGSHLSHVPNACFLVELFVLLGFLQYVFVWQCLLAIMITVYSCLWGLENQVMGKGKLWGTSGGYIFLCYDCARLSDEFFFYKKHRGSRWIPKSNIYLGISFLVVLRKCLKCLKYEEHGMLLVGTIRT